MDWTLLLLLFIGILHGSQAVNDPQCDDVNTGPQEPEHDHDDTECPSGMFDCNPAAGSFECIAYTLVCDGDFDCATGNEDEVYCAIRTGTATGNMANCGAGDLWCADRSDASLCVDAGDFCDTTTECANGADEIGCYDPDDLICDLPTRLCPMGQVLCADGESCLVSGDWCNGGTDCPSGEDEDPFICAATCSDCPGATTPTPNAACQIVYWSPPAATAATYGVISDCNHLPGTTFPPGEVTTVIYTICEGGTVTGDKSYCKFEVTVPAAGTCDPPVTGCPNQNLEVIGDAAANGAIVDFGPVSSDATAIKELINGAAPGSQFPCGYTKVTYKFTDVDGSESYCSFFICVKCTNDPVSAVCNLTPIDTTVDYPDEKKSVKEYLEEQLDEQIFDEAGIVISYSYSHDLDYEFPIGTTQFTLTLRDSAGNSHQCDTPITISRPFDDIAPTLVCPPDTTVCYGADDLTAGVTTGSWTEPEPQDEGTIVENYCDHSPNNYLQIPAGDEPKQTEVTCYATDWNGNKAQCSFTLTFELDDQAPYITNCNNYTEYTTQTSGSILVNYPEPDISDNCDEYQVTVSPSRDTEFDVESIHRITYSVEDKAGNTAQCEFTVEVRIDQLPTFQDCPTSFTIATDPGTTEAEVSWEAPKVQDDNGLDVYQVELTVSPSLLESLDPLEEEHELTLEKGVYVVTYSYTDVNLQTGICTFTVTVQDSEAPEFTRCPSNLERTLNSQDTTVTVAWLAPTANDNDGQPVSIAIQNDQYKSGEPFRAGEYTIVYVAKDEAGNEGFCSFILTVNPYDTGNFWVNCTRDIDVSTDPGQPTAVVTWDPPELRTGVDNPRWQQTHSPGIQFVIGDTRVEYTARDKADNSDTCSFTVTVEDLEAPVIISCPGDCTVYGLAGRDSVPVYWYDPRTSDNSGSTVSLGANPFGPGTEFGFGTHQVYYSAVDPSGNTATGCHFQVTVQQPGDTYVVTGSAEFSSIRGVDSQSAISQAANLADDLDKLFRDNTAISKIIAGVQVGTPSPLSDGDVLVPFTLYLAQCRASFLHVRDSMTQNLEGNNRDSFDSNNVVYPETFRINTREFLVSALTISHDRNLPTGQMELIFNSDYNNPRTSAYQALEDRICDVMDILFSSFSGYCGCSVWFFRSGSIAADLILIFADSSSVSQSAIQDQILNSVDLSGGEYNLYNLILENFDLTTVTEVCPDGFCQNGGTCEPNAATYDSQCRCPPDFTGTQCQTGTGEPAGPDDEEEGGNGAGLSTEEIIGIVVGVVGGLLLLIILLACFCVFCLRPTEPKPQPIIQEPPEPAYNAIAPPPQNVFVRDCVEPPPVPRPVPIRVPNRFPVPVPAPDPFPVPVPHPVGRPFPVPVRTPVPAPFRVPVPQAVPRPYPVPFRQPFPVPQRIPFPVRQPVAVPTPVPVPVNVAVPIRDARFGGAGLNGAGFGPAGFNGANFGAAGLNNGAFLNGVPVTGLTRGLGGFNTTGF